MVKYGGQLIASSGYVSQVDEKLCTSCGVCVEACPFGALTMDGGAKVIWEKCLGCGVCTGQCPTEAIALIRDERKGVPMDVRLLT
jgi:heterodisulfide reductase subunit A-like polyferredoxin